MKASTSNITRGKANVAAGKTQRAAGKVVRSPKLQVKGALREAGGRIEPGKAKPIDGTVRTDKRGSVAIADQRVLFDGQRHKKGNVRAA